MIVTNSQALADGDIKPVLLVTDLLSAEAGRHFRHVDRDKLASGDRIDRVRWEYLAVTERAFASLTPDRFDTEAHV
ncbi:MAG: hypothetical protein VB860_06420 [Dehalococcoidia bacterium]